MTSAMLQMQALRALIQARTVGDQALWSELADLLHSVFDSLDNLRTQINELKGESTSQAEAIESRGRAIQQLAQQSRGGGNETPF